jgi:signal transduction histidine kinase
VTTRDKQIHSISAVLDSLGIGLCIYSDDDRAVFWNSTFLALFPEHDGFIHAGEHYRDNLRRFYGGRLTPSEMPLMDKYIETGVERHRTQEAPFTFEHRGRWLRVASLPLPGLGRVRIWAPIPSPTMTVPTPAHEESGPALESTHLFEHMADGIMVVDVDGLISWVNDRFVIQYGMGSKASVIGQRFETVYAAAWAEQPASDGAAYAQARGALADNMRFTGAPFQLPLPGDRWMRVLARQSSTGISYFAHADITLLERHRRELAEKTLQLETTLRSITQGIFMIDAAGHLTIYNDRFRELLDLPDELLATRPTLPEITHFQLKRGDFGESQKLVQPHARAYVTAASQETVPEYYLRTTHDGRVLEVKSQSLPDGGLVRTFTDVTDHVNVKDELQKLNDELEERVNRRTAQLEAANRELEAFSYSVAHDLRQPLSSIDGFASLLAGMLRDGTADADKDAAARATHYATRMRVGIRQMSASTDGLLALAQLSRAKLSWKDFDLGAEARRVAERLAEHQPQAGPAREVRIDIEPNLLVRGEPVLLRQVVENLMGNAWKFTARRADAHIVVGCRVQPDGSAGYFVRDNGAGFDMAYANKLFGAFQRLHSPTEFPGTGIGLAIVQRIITRHGGRVWAEGVEGEGATFHFTLGAPPDDAP